MGPGGTGPAPSLFTAAVQETGGYPFRPPDGADKTARPASGTRRFLSERRTDPRAQYWTDASGWPLATTAPCDTRNLTTFK